MRILEEPIMSKWSSAFRDSRWQQKRLKIMERDNWTCCNCGAKGEGVTLNVHHMYYEKNKSPWEYDDETLITWCEKCHKKIHENLSYLTVRICSAQINLDELILQLVGFIDGSQGPASCSFSKDYSIGYASARIGQCMNSMDAVSISSSCYNSECVKK